MAKVKPCKDSTSGKPNGNYYFRCPATGKQYEVSTKHAWKANQIVYGFNGNLEAPTFSHSILIVNGQLIGNGEPVNTNDATVNNFAIVDGNIRYFENCTHALKGKTVPLPDLN